MVGVLEEKSMHSKAKGKGVEKSRWGRVSAAEKESAWLQCVCVKFEGCEGKKGVICRVNGQF